ncbi:TonB-dependent receptor domain-containing protein [Campylobacter troglodytis]|uniref:TonB-dependent receptor domain-containing protein n=1 Tax=Campylobacter troglodytis TaxID=654363 RepID=UPI00115A5F7F|nr:TonB-dependent receptor [Campylobacter troglodytis]TQR61402.1 ferric enterobactin uptake receptor [Campylobacter troglodytis]
MQRHKFSLAAVFFMVAGGGGLAFGDETYTLESTVISASGYEQEIKYAPASTSVITGEELSKMPVRDLAEAIGEIPGVDLHASKGKTGGFNITMRGLTNYTLVLVDGKKVSTTSNNDLGPNGFGEFTNTFLPPLSSIERIEVIRGPMSTLYGSEALGGVINIITKKASKNWQTSVSFDSLLQEHRDYGNAFNFGIFSRGPLIEDKLDVQLRARTGYRHPADVRNQNGTIRRPHAGDNPTKANLYNFGARLSYLFDEKNTVIADVDFSYHHYDNRQSQMGNRTVREANGLYTGGYPPTVIMKKLSGYLAHEGRYDGLNLNSSLSFNEYANMGREVVATGTSRDGSNRDLRTRDYIAESKGVLALGEYNTLSLGASYQYSTFRDRLVEKTHFNSSLLGVFAEDELNIFNKVFLTLGARYNYHDTFGSNVSPRAYVVAEIMDNLMLKGGVSTGFKAPPPNRLTPGNYNLSGQGTTYVYGNPKLKEETSINYELGFTYDSNFLTHSVTGFYTVFDNKLSSQSVAQGTTVPNTSVLCATNEICSQAINLGKVEYRGFEVGSTLRPIDNLAFNLSYTYLDSKVKKDQNGVNVGKPEAGSLKHNIITKASYKIASISPWIKGEWQLGRYRGSSQTPGTTDLFRGSRYYGDVFLASVGVGYELNKNWNFNLAVYNVLDKNFVKEFDTPTNGHYNRIEERRRYYISVNGSF